jgi:hypothetical protein
MDSLSAGATMRAPSAASASGRGSGESAPSAAAAGAAKGRAIASGAGGGCDTVRTACPSSTARHVPELLFSRMGSASAKAISPASSSWYASVAVLRTAAISSAGTSAGARGARWRRSATRRAICAWPDRSNAASAFSSSPSRSCARPK